ncbi:MAG: hypothetical protein SFY56_15460 [Bacteroidota bacterium]|nr:hypothetical protein [Bacteroidota bacterium]
MISAITYLLLFLFLIYKTNFFGIIKDEAISPKFFSLLFLLKAAAIPVFIIIYKRFYGGLENFDAGNFYNDAKSVNAFGHHHFFEYLKMIFGLQNDNEGSFCYTNCLVNTRNWDNGRIHDFLYNDNRVVIRIHSLLHFIAFNSYYVHALFSCFLSFLGIVYLYKSLKEFFVGKEMWLILVLCLFPTLWFYTGSISKEALTLCFLGCGVYQIKKIFLKDYTLPSLIFSILILFTAFFLKPYILIITFLCFALFFKIYYSQKIHFKVLIYCIVLFFTALLTNTVVNTIKHKTLFEIALERQRIFADASTGGIFLLDSSKFVRLDYDSSLIKKQVITGLNSAKKTYYTIKLNSPYIYWEHTHQEDTLFCAANKDTIAKYTFVYDQPKSGSNFVLPNSFLHLTISSFYYTLFYPLFFNAKNSLQYIASFENVTIVISLVLILFGFVKSNKQKFIPITFLSLAFIVCFLVGITTPNSGAIVRYRSLVVIFILLSALYYMPVRNLNFKPKH